MLITPNIPEKSLNQFTPINPGWYEAEIFDAQVNQASTGTEFLNIEFKIQAPENFKGRSTWGVFYLTENASWKIATLQNGIGMEPGKKFHTNELVGKTLRIRLKEVEDQEGNPKIEVSAFRRLKNNPVEFAKPASEETPF
jgi:Protein of unknown function (DUF669)